MTAGFNVHYDVEQQYPYWLVVAGTVTLFIGGIVGHLGKFRLRISGHKNSIKVVKWRNQATDFQSQISYFIFCHLDQLRC